MGKELRRRGWTLGSGSFSLISFFQTWRQLWRVLEMSDIVLLITDIRHPVSTEMKIIQGGRQDDSCGIKGKGKG